MIAPLLIAERLEARTRAANAVRSAFYERFGEQPSAEDRLWQIDPITRQDFVGDIELKLGVIFRDEDVEFLETPSDLIERATEILIRGDAR